MAFSKSALIGTITWVAGVLALGLTSWSEHGAVVLLLFGSAVTTPLALALVEPRHGRDAPGRWRWTRRAHLPASVLLIGSFACPAGVAAGLLSVPWLLFTGLVALLGVLRFAARGGGPSGEIARDAGLVFLVVGGVWTTSSRCGITLFGFGEPWVLLTGAHFHFAGLVLPIVAGCVASRQPSRVGAAASIGVVAGVPMVAVGITTRGTFEWFAVLWLVASCGLVIIAMLEASRRAPRRPGTLLALAALCLTGGMALAIVYTTGVWLEESWLDLPAMIDSHAVLNVFGFSLLALLALRALPAEREAASMEILIPALGDQPAEDWWEDRPFGPDASLVDEARDDEHTAELPSEAPGPPAIDGPFASAAEQILDFRAFPNAVLRGLVERTPIEQGDTVRAMVRLFPGLHLVFASRVVVVFDDVRDGVHRRGFTYRTLIGHPVTGEETFAVEKDAATGRVRVTISARSFPGTWLSRVMRGWGRRLQTRAGRAGVEHLRDRAFDGNRAHRSMPEPR